MPLLLRISYQQSNSVHRELKTITQLVPSVRVDRDCNAVLAGCGESHGAFHLLAHWHYSAGGMLEWPRGAVQIVRFRWSKTIVRSNYTERGRASEPASSQSADGAGPPRCPTQRAGIAPPHAEGDGLSGVASDRESNAFISVPASFVGGVPVTRARNPWAMPEAT